MKDIMFQKKAPMKVIVNYLINIGFTSDMELVRKKVDEYKSSR